MRLDLIKFIISLGLAGTAVTPVAAQVNASKNTQSHFDISKIIDHPFSTDLRQAVELQSEYAIGLQELYDNERKKLNLPPKKLLIAKDSNHSGECVTLSEYDPTAPDSIASSTVITPNFLLNYTEYLDVIFSHELGHELKMKQLVESGVPLKNILKKQTFEQSRSSERYADSIAVSVHGVDKFIASIANFADHKRVDIKLDLKFFIKNNPIITRYDNGKIEVDWVAFEKLNQTPAEIDKESKSVHPWMEILQNMKEQSTKINESSLISFVFEAQEEVKSRTDVHKSYRGRIEQAKNWQSKIQPDGQNTPSQMANIRRTQQRG